MGLTDWINNDLPEVVKKIEATFEETYAVNTEEGLNLAGRDAVYNVLDSLLTVMFPGFFSKTPVQKRDLNLYIGDILRHSAQELFYQIRHAFKFRCRLEKCESCDCEKMAEEAVQHMLTGLPALRELLLTDIKAAYDGDPAAQSFDEIVMSYPFVEAVATQRIAHELYLKDVPLIPRIMSERAHSRTGIDIHPGAVIGESFFIDHGTGVVIGETTTIGKNVKLYQGVTLGALSFPLDADGNPVKGVKRHPDIEDDVIIYAGATILGGDTVVGKGSVIGGNVWLTTSVPAGSKIYNKQPQPKFEDGAGI
ncbi:serine O-acetyltransferase [Planctomycetota bacterium]